MSTTPREPCWPVWIYDESDWDHSAGYFGYVRYSEKDRLERILQALSDADFAFTALVGLYMQEETDERVPRPLARFVERALEPWLHHIDPHEGVTNLAEIGATLAPFGLRL